VPRAASRLDQARKAQPANSDLTKGRIDAAVVLCCAHFVANIELAEMQDSFRWPMARSREERLPKALSRRADLSRGDILLALRASQDFATAIQEWRAGDLYRTTSRLGSMETGPGVV
jgi:hypothetical protein